MSLSLEEVRRVAALARLGLAPAEEARFAEQLSRVVDYIDQLDRFPGGADEAIAAPSPEADDRPAPCLPPELFLANAPAHDGTYLLVPRVLGGDD